MNLRSKKSIAVILVILILVTLLAFYSLRDEGASVVYRTAKVDSGDISSYVNATGTVNPVTTVEIGSQVAGTVQNVYVDFNTLLKEGEALAKIDLTPFQAKLNQAEADLRKARADAELANTVMQANKELYEQRLISKQEYEDSRVKYSAAIAALEQAKAALDIARSDLNNTTIRSPIDGIVISRNVNVGQTVGPEQRSEPLFVIAEDLARMKVDTYISEADIGKIESNQEAFFTVDAYPNQTFQGNVWQVRNKPTTSNNIVTYDVVILVDNEGRKLKPGMTADVRILTAHKENVLRVPRAALRFIPPPSAQIEGKSQENIGNRSVVWVPVENQKIKAVPISTGVSGDAFTEVLDGNLKEGQKVVVEASEKSESDSELGPVVLPKPERF
ncbi:MAG TPA: efflux RND transporter periplasmic adaptor subunit [Thermodesulfobacteriota bacterium]|nr:efflux RND transporter periplasmic adaptor subunit [Thermodesulfobacteriota bacterium]